MGNYPNLFKRGLLNQFREMIRSYYVYGFSSRAEVTDGSERSCSNSYLNDEKIEFWLDGYMHRRKVAKNGYAKFGKYISVSGSEILENPLHRLFHASIVFPKSLAAHFYMQDLLLKGPKTGSALFAHVQKSYEDMDTESYRSISKGKFDSFLKEYVDLGILTKEDEAYRLSDSIPLPPSDALLFAAEQTPLGVIGSFLLDGELPRYMRFKHHYLLDTLDSDVLYALILAVRGKKKVLLETEQSAERVPFIPCRFYFGTQTGRQYVIGFDPVKNRPRKFRIDRIRSVDVSDGPAVSVDLGRLSEYESHLWNISDGRYQNADGPLIPKHFEMTVSVLPHEGFILRRLEREKKQGTLERVDETHWKFSVDVYDPVEMMPWIRTFTGRITGLSCADEPDVIDRFRTNLHDLAEQYGVTDI